MSDWLLQQLAVYGVPLLFVTTLLSCLALPVPSSLMMLASGAFVASGDLPLASVALAALGGALIGDQIGYLIGFKGKTAVGRHMELHPKRAALMQRAQALTARWGDLGVFFSRWLAAPLGPYVNVASGVTGFSHARFTLWAAAGEVVWVALYVGLGYSFAGNIGVAAELAGDASGVIAGGTVTLGLGLWLRKALHEAHPPGQKETHHV